MPKIAIVSAMNEEIEFLIQKFDNVQTEVINHFTFYKANYNGNEIILSKSGIGKTAAGMLIATLNNNFLVDYVINTGICGGRLGKSKLGDVIVMDKCVYGDFDISSISSCKYGQISGLPECFISDYMLKSLATNAIIGDFLTSDKFANNYEETEGLINKYFSDYNICGFDMESAAFAHGCYILNLPFIAIRATSDVVGVTSSDEYNSQEVDLCKVSCEYLYKFLMRLVNKLCEN